MKTRLMALMAFAFALGPAGCTTDTRHILDAQIAAPIGTLRGSCYPNNTCNEALSCISGVCVALQDGGAPAPRDSISGDVPLPTDLGACPRPCVITVAGTGEAGLRNGPSLAARFSSPQGLALDRDNTLYVADRDNHCIRRVRSGTVDTIAGTGEAGNVDGPLELAQFNSPVGLSYSSDHRLWVADVGNGQLRAVLMASALVKRGAAPGLRPHDVAVDGYGSIYVTNADTGDISSLINLSATKAEPRFQTGIPRGIATDSLGVVYVTSSSRNTLHRYRPHSVELVLGTNTAGDPGFVDGGPETARMTDPRGLVVAKHGRIIIADTGNHAVRLLSENTLKTLAGDGSPGHRDGPAPGARFNGPSYVAVDSGGVIYVSDTGNHQIRAIIP